MKKEILDIPIRDSFIDFLDKGEKLLWTNATEERMSELNYSYKENNTIITPEQFVTAFIISFSIGLLFYIFSAKSADLQSLIFYSIIGGIYICIFHLLKRAPPHLEAYVITPKRILFKTSYFPNNEIHQIYFSQIKDFIPQSNRIRSMSFILVIKDPKSVHFKTLERHHPTLENIKDFDEVTKLLRQGIQQNH